MMRHTITSHNPENSHSEAEGDAREAAREVDHDHE